jgi:S-DNA-T family DNA segregation ATPase FtsK/SpoIIIE
MASYHIRSRDPLLDSTMRASLERRGRELLGLALLTAGVLLMLMLASYTPDDPNWMAATDEPAQNWLGRFGAALAAVLFLIAGHGSWALALVLVVWGLRFVLHYGQERALNRLIFAPIGIAVAAIYASTLVPGADWPHSFGLGGLGGDTVLGGVLGIVPVEATSGLKVLSALLALAMLGLGLFVLGCTGREIRAFIRFMLVGLVMSYAALLAALGRAARGGVSAAQASRIHLADRRAARMARAEARAAMAEEDDALVYPDTPAPPQPARETMVWRTGATPGAAQHPVAPEPARHSMAPRMAVHPAHAGAQPHIARMPEQAPLAAPQRAAHPGTMHAAPRPQGGALGGLLSRLPDLVKRPAEAELVEPPISAVAESAERPSEDRIKARIASAIKARSRQVPTLRIKDTAPAPTASPAHGGAPALPGMRPTPPLTARHAERLPDLAPPPSAVHAPYGTLPDAASPGDGPLADDFDDSAPYRDAPLDSAPWDDVPHEPLIDTPAPVPARATAMPRVFTPEPRKVVQHAPRKPVQPSRRAQAEAQPALRFDEPEHQYELPPLSLLSSPESIQRHLLSDEALEENARMLENVLDDYGVKGEIVSVRPGPVVTMYELEPAPGLKASRVIGLADDIARSMSALSARVSTVPGRSVIGIELPNAHREKVVLREILSARDFGDSQMRLPLALGKDIGGAPIVANLAKMPHLLIAGTTGSGKSVAINTMILSLLYKLSPDECRLIMIDPKMLELSVYDGIPHLLSPVVTDPKKAVVALKWVVGEMEERYRKMSKMGVRNIEGYNGRVRETLAKGQMFQRTVQTGFDDETGEPVFETEEFLPETLPFIVVIVDEMADLMMVAGKEIEACIQRLAQMARASGIHLIMATQRPSVDVITGTIKANFPTRISFQVTSKIDSRTILGEMGAEQLLGMGDMLYMAGGGRITRIHGPFVSDEEVEEIVNHLKSFGPPSYVGGVIEGPEDGKEADIDLVLGLGGGDNSDDALYDQAVAIVARDRKCSTSYIQRKLGIGYQKAARLVEQMEDQGVVSTANHVGKREILLPE